MKKLFFILLSIQMIFALEVQELQDGDIIDDSIERLEKNYYKINAVAHGNLRVTLTNLNSKIYLYTKTPKDQSGNTDIRKMVPSFRTNDCYSTRGDHSKEECFNIVDVVIGRDDYASDVYIMIYGAEAGSYRLEVKEEAAEKLEILTEKALNGSVQKGEEKNYKIDGKAGEVITVILSDLNADADLRLKIGRKASRNSFDCKSTNGGSKTDSCTVTLVENATVYVNVDGYKAADYSIKKDIKDNKNQTLITKAKKYCQNQENSTNKVLCSLENNQVYIIEKEDADDVINVISTENQWSLLSKSMINYHGYSHSLSLHKLEDTELFYLKSATSRNSFFNFYYFSENNLKSALKSLSIETDTFVIDSFKTIYNGKKLLIEFHHKTSGDKLSYLYDISNLAEIKLIAK